MDVGKKIVKKYKKITYFHGNPPSTIMLVKITFLPVTLLLQQLKACSTVYTHIFKYQEFNCILDNTPFYQLVPEN